MQREAERRRRDAERAARALEKERQRQAKEAARQRVYDEKEQKRLYAEQRAYEAEQLTREIADRVEQLEGLPVDRPVLGHRGAQGAASHDSIRSR